MLCLSPQIDWRAPGRVKQRVVLVDDPAEDIMATDRPDVLRPFRGFGHGEVEAPVGTGSVVMADVVAEDRFELAARIGDLGSGPFWLISRLGCN